MIVFVDMEHASLASMKPEVWKQVAFRRLQTKYRLEELSGQPCHIVRYTDWGQFLSCSLFRYVEAVVFSGFNTLVEDFGAGELDPVCRWLGDPQRPTLTICGSAQLMAEVHGVRVGSIGVAAADDVRIEDPVIPSEMIGEVGFCPVRCVSDSQLLDRDLVVYQHHYWEAKDVPEGFRLTASSDVCRVQALEHMHLQLTGFQFHPEDYDDHHPDGRELLYRWLKIAGCAR